MKEQHELPRLLGRFRGAFLSVGIFSIFFNLLILTLPFYMLSVFTRVLSSKSEETLILLSLAAGIALAMQGLLDLIRTRILVRVGMGLNASLTPQVLEAVVRDAAGSAKRNTQPLNDASELRSFLSGTGIFALFDAPFAPFYVVVIYLLHPALGTLALVGALVLFAIAVVNEMITRKPIRAAANFSSMAQARVEQFVRNSDAIEAMGMMPAVIDRWRIHNGDALTALSQAADKVNAAGALAKFVRMTLQISMFGVGAYLYIQHQLLPGAMIAAAILMGRALAPVEMAISTWKSLVSAKSAYSRLKSSLDPERFRLYQNRMELPRPNGLLHLERVVVMAPGSDRMILKGVGFHLRPGEFLGVIGPSGAGKSTLAKVLVGILPPRGGTARLDGTELGAWHPDDLGQHIGYLPQDVQLFPGTVRENIARMALDGSADAVIRAAQTAGVHETILGLPEGYDTDIGDFGGLLSAGQRQHIALARAFFGDPSLLILDEPNSNLDSVSEEALRRALATAKERGTTIVVITHRPSILRAADQLLLLKEGTVELYGPSDQVKARMSQGALTQEERKRIAVVKDSDTARKGGRIKGRSGSSGNRRIAANPGSRTKRNSGEAAKSGEDSAKPIGEVANKRRPAISDSEQAAKSHPDVDRADAVAVPEREAGQPEVESTIIRVEDKLMKHDNQ